MHLCTLPDQSSETAPFTGISTATAATAKVDYSRRRKVAPNHTMTHVLNYALKDVLKSDVDQKGSQVSDEKLRYV